MLNVINIDDHELNSIRKANKEALGKMEEVI